MLKELLFGMNRVKEPIFLKEFSEQNSQLDDLINLSKKVKSDKKKYIDKDIKYLKYGIEGEKNVSYELKNSFIPMIIMHDIRISELDYAAQMDYVIITEQYIMILETKKLNGDITINESGEFIRSFKADNGRIYKKEGIYSPVSQNERHVRILEKILKENGIIKNIPIYSLVVIANPKSIINKYKAPNEIKAQITKYDQLTRFLRDKCEEEKKQNKGIIYEKTMRSIANFLIDNHSPIKFDYNSKYSLAKEDFIEAVEDKEYAMDKNILATESNNEDNFTLEETIKDIESPIVEKGIEEKDLRDKLKLYRLERAREEKVPPYYIFNDKTMDEIIEKLPRSEAELLKIRGFGKVKVQKYGQYILELIK